MGNLSGFNAADVDPTDQFEPLQNGEYTMVITDSEMKPSKSGGQYLQLILEVVDGQNKGRKVWDRLNLENSNRTAVEIAQRQLSQLCHAIGIMCPDDSQDLHNKPILVKIAYRPASGKFEASNDVKGYKPLGGSVAAPAQTQQAKPQKQKPQQQPMQQQPAPSKPSNQSAPPWAAQ